MQAAQDKARVDHEMTQRDYEKTLASLKKSKVKLSKAILDENPNAPWDIGLGRLYCKAIALLLPKAAHAQAPPTQGSPTQGSPTQGSPTRGSPTQGSQIYHGPPPDTSTERIRIEALRARLDDSSQLMNAYGVEIHKKFALAVACFVFVLLGAPIALRFPRGGVGLTIGVSLFVFALYYVCLIAGESIAKRGLMPAVVSMWMANVIFASIALVLLAKMGKEGSTARGGDMKEMFDSIRGWARSKIGRRKPVVQPERAAA
jgi:hypothetical protein